MTRTIQEVRLANLELLIAEFRTVEALASKGDTAANHLSALRSRTRTGSGTIRGIGNQLARKLEMKTGKAAGWMDTDHNQEPAPETLQAPAPYNVESRLRPEEIDLLLMFRALPDKLKDDLLVMADRWFRRETDTRSTPRPTLPRRGRIYEETPAPVKVSLVKKRTDA